MSEDKFELRKCERCSYWESGGKGVGLCKRYAPMAIVNRRPPGDTAVYWPKMCGDDWCGEFEPRMRGA